MKWDTTKPVPINEEEELERLSGMMERDNLVRALGIADFVTEMLQAARITVKVIWLPCHCLYLVCMYVFVYACMCVYVWLYDVCVCVPLPVCVCKNLFNYTLTYKI